MAGGGVNRNLFQKVILESGAATGLTPIPKSDYAPRQQQYNSIVQKSGYVSLLVYLLYHQANSQDVPMLQTLLSASRGYQLIRYPKHSLRRTPSLIRSLIIGKFTNVCFKYSLSDFSSYAPIVEGNVRTTDSFI